MQPVRGGASTSRSGAAAVQTAGGGRRQRRQPGRAVPTSAVLQPLRAILHVCCCRCSPAQARIVAATQVGPRLQPREAALTDVCASTGLYKSRINAGLSSQVSMGETWAQRPSLGLGSLLPHSRNRSHHAANAGVAPGAAGAAGQRRGGAAVAPSGRQGGDAAG